MELQLLESFAGVFGHELGEPDHDRHHQQGRHRQPGIEHEHGDQDADHGQQAGDQ